MKIVHLKSVALAGVAHLTNEETKALYSVEDGQPLELVRQPNNKFDKNAIAVVTYEDVKIGWIPKVANQPFAAMIDGGLRLYAFLCPTAPPEEYYLDVMWEREETEAEKAQETQQFVKKQGRKRRVRKV